MSGKSFRQFVNEGGFDQTIYNNWIKDVNSANESYNRYVKNSTTTYDKNHDLQLSYFDRLINRGNNIKKMLSSRAIKIGNVADVDETLSHLNEMKKGINSVAEFYSQFENEDSFYDWSFNNKYAGKSLKEIDDFIRIFSKGKASNEMREYDWLVSNRDYFMSPDELLSEIKLLEENSASLKRNKWKTGVEFVGTGLSGQNADSAYSVYQKNKSAETENAARLDKLKKLYASHGDVSSEKLDALYKKADEKNIFSVLSPDYTYADYANDKADKNIYGSAYIQRKDQENLEIIQKHQDEFDSDVSAIESIISSRLLASDLASSATGGNILRGLNEGSRKKEIRATDPEILAIKQKWTDKGYDFDALFETHERNSNTQYTEAVKNQKSEYAKEHPVLANIESVGTNLIGGISALPSAIGSGIEDILSDEVVTMDTNSPEWTSKNITDAIRDATSELLNTGEYGKFKAFLYQTGMSIADFSTTAVATGFAQPATLLLMGSNAAVDTMKNVTERGGSASDALTMGFFAGVFEAIMEKVPLDTIFKSVNTATGKAWIRNVFNGMMTEGFEELGTDLANNLVDVLLNADQAEFNQNVFNYMKNGMSASEASTKVFMETAANMGLSFLGGAISGGGMTAVGGGIGLARADSEYKNIGNSIMSHEDGTDTVMAFAKELVDRDKAVAKDVKKVENKKSARNVGRLYADTQNALHEQNRSTYIAEAKKGIQGRVEALGLDKSTSKAAADIIYKAYNGEELTERQQKILKDNKHVARAYRELSAYNTQEGRENYTNSWVQVVNENIEKATSHVNEKIKTISAYSDAVSDTADSVTDVVTEDTFAPAEVDTVPAVINGTEEFTSFVAEARAEDMNFGVVKKYNATELNNTAEGQLAVLDAYGKKHGLSFIVVDSIGSDVSSQKANGAYIGKNKIMISLDSEAGAILSVAGHEVYHYISNNNKSSADSIKSFVLDKLKNNSEYNYSERFEKLAKDYGTEDVDTIEEEMVANAMFDILADENVINGLANENPSLLEKIITAIKDFVSELKNMAKNLPWKEVAVFQDDIQSLETIKAMAEAALWQINESGKNTSDSTENATKNTATDDGVKMSISSDFAKQLSSWDKKTTGFSFVVGYSSDALLKAGVPYKQIRWDATKIKNTLEKHSENGIDIKVLEKVPELLENPILIVDSKTVPGRLVVLGELYDNNGKIVVVALELNPKTKKGATLENIIKIATSQGRSHIQSLLDSEIRYIDENKERVQNWLNVNRLQLPLRSFNLNSITNISQNDTPVNTKYAQNGKDDTPKFSLAKSIERTKELIAVHNLTQAELMKSLELGGLPMPSIAIIKAERGHSKYGDVSIVFPSDIIDPAKSSENKIYGGDAWTPVYPNIEYKVNDEVQQKISKLYYDIYEKYGRDEARPLYNYVYDLEHQLNSAGGEDALIDRIKDDEDMMQLYLLVNGKSKVAPVIKQKVSKLTDSEVEMFDYLINSLGRDVILELKTPAGEKATIYRRAYNEKYGSQIEASYKQMLKDCWNFSDKEISNVVENMSKGDFAKIIKNAYNYLQNGRTTITEETDYAGTSAAIRAAVKDSSFESWVDDLFAGVAEKSGIRNNADAFTASGNRRSWEALHWENNLENVVKIMKSQQNGETFFSGQGIWGVSAKNYRSIDDVVADSGRLQTMPEEQYNKIKENFGARFNEIAVSIMNKNESNQFIAVDNAMQCIIDAVRNSKTKSGIYNELKKYRQLEVTETAVDDIVSLVSDIANMPTGYFEAKPQKAITFNDVATVIIPDSIDNEIKSKLDESGVSYIEYESNNEQSRLEKLNSLDGVKFSYASRKAKTANISKFAEAVRLEYEDNLSSRDEIRQKTGWFRGYDGKWRFEIDDSKMKVSTSGLYSRNPDIRRYQELQNKIYFEDNATAEERAEFKKLSDSLDGTDIKPRLLGDLIEHDELFKAYPQLEDVFISFEKDTGKAGGWYDPVMNEIVVNRDYVLKKEELKGVLLHEIQHAVQHIEGIAEGTAPETYQYDKNARYDTLSYRKFVEAENKLKNVMKYSDEDISDIVGEYNSETMYEELSDSEYIKAYEKAAKQIKDENLLDVFWEYAEARERLYKELSTIEKDSPMDLYYKTAGEIEARDVTKRMSYNAEYRKSIRPDIDRTDVVFADGDVNIKLSLKETAEASENRENLIKANDNLRVANALLKKEFHRTKGKMLSYSTAKNIAKEMTEYYSSSYDSEVLAREIYNIFEWYDKNDGTYDYLVDYLANIGKKVVAQSSAVDTSLYDDYAEAREWIRNMRFTLPEKVLAQMNEEYDGKFVRKTFGRMKYVSREKHPDAPYLSAIYSELANEYPNFFSIEDNEYEQPMRLIEFWEKIQPTYYNPLTEMGYATEDDAAVGFAYKTFEKYLEQPVHQTFADKKQKQIDSLRKEYSRNIEAAKKKFRADRDKKIEEVKHHYREAREKNVEGRKKTVVKNKIRKTIKELSKILTHGTKERNVKFGMQDSVESALAVAEILFSDDISNADLIRAGIPGVSEAESKSLNEYVDLLDKKQVYLDRIDALGHNRQSDNVADTLVDLHKMVEVVDKKIKKLDVQLKDLFEREKRKYDATTVNTALTNLADTYKKLAASEFLYIASAYDENLYNHITAIKDNLEGAKISQMSLQQLESVHQAYKMVLSSVKNANKIFTAEKSETVEKLGTDAMREIRDVGGYKDRRIKALKFIKKVGWQELKPIYAFRFIGSDTLTARYKAMRNGEDTYYTDVADAKKFILNTKKTYNAASWDLKKTYGFESKNGDKFNLTLEQIMSLYAYSRRGQQATNHITMGGIVFGKDITVAEKKKGVTIKYNVDNATAYNISEETLGDIISTLTDKQKAFVEEAQGYLSDVMGKKGNDVSMELYGVNLFNEKNYFPLKSSEFYRAFDGKVAGEAAVKNSGFTNSTVIDAVNPVVLDDFSKVWSQHVHDMSMYHAFVLPIEDFTKVFNFKTPTAEDKKTTSLKATLQGAYGSGAEQYIRNLLTDLNGGVRSQGGTEVVNKLTSLAKKGAVFASMSVTIQQPSAVVRAIAHISPKYFMTAFPKSANWLKVKNEWEQLKKYAPVAGIKEMGYFDTGLGISTTDWIMAEEYETFGKKFVAFWKDGQYRDEVFSELPSKADEISWVYIWNAVKKEIADKSDAAVGSEEFLIECGKRFTEVIELTQVYDSVFSRSGLMRSKDTGVKMATAFMAEPTTQVNMLVDSIVQGKRTNKTYIARAFGAVFASILVNALLKSIITAGRDDDEDLNYGEKYIGNLVSSFVSDASIVSAIPFARDIISIIQGFEVERMDMTIIADVVNAISALESEEKSTYAKISGLATSLLAMVGVPAKNIEKDLRMVYNTYITAARDYSFSEAAVKESVIRNLTGKSTAKGDLLYFSIVNGDEKYASRIRAMYNDETSADTAIRTALRKYDSRIYEAAVARVNGDIAEYMRIAKEIIAEKNFSQDNIVKAINAECNALKSDDNEKGQSDEALSMFKDDDYYSAILAGDGSIAKIVADDLIKADIKNGKTQEEAEKSLNNSLRNNIKEALQFGDVQESEAIKILTDYAGMDKNSAENRVQYWNFTFEYPEYSLSEDAVTSYYDKVESSGISVEIYAEYYERQSECKGKKDSDGKTIAGSKKAEILKVINSLSITNRQKDALYYLNGWAESTINEAPWR